ncbi:putative unusual protein kinase regulating ubiquinone biosynthesis (AarF/ABC1/UbiB family) [Nocardioides ginsengisegetis]|uniref:Putative unusual protein kinase regulating ubiquinone biosynthesis (AarF/ABC1/UbiB family) n=1 Tax=Nocardioides ginsengisegetis TaxID=661491 RepID=A0A7W3J3P1_9ACTN|nr:AarF/UbiB family protein [Nocardioides ginsengisegetis]MBA8805712.1 putative unusual protein kinase regulating ubiquinone biosynthesis (AarF/ABC1/UbiB family) [Nocardioides ginsengisegetis]
MGTPTSSTQRYAALARLLVRHGRSDLLAGAGLDEFSIDDDMPAGDVDEAEAFARDLENLGPTYVKLGQLLSTRFDLLPTAYTTALARLQDAAEPFPFEQVQEIVEGELGGQIRHLFADFDPEPMAVASLGQVHRATLPSGRRVVVKVQRPDARDQAREDMEVLAKLAGLADRHTGAGRRYGFGDLLTQFRRSLAGELDYRREARNLAKFRELCAGYDLLVVPEPVPDHSSSRVLTMERLDGRKVTDVGPLGLLEVEARPMVDQLFACYLKLMLQDGVLHADPHPGNVLLTDDGRLGLLDLGMVTTVPGRLQDRLVRLLLAIGDGDGDEAAAVLAGMGHPLDDYDAAAFRDEVAHLVTEAAVAGSDVQAGTVLMELSRTSGQHGLRPPAEMSMVGKALLNLDRVTLHLDPDFDPAQAIRSNVGDLLTSGLKVSPAGVMAAAIEAKEFTALLPKRANRILDALAEGEFSVRVQAMDEERLHRVLQRVANRVTLGIIIAATVLGAALMMRVPTDHRIWGYPALAMGFFMFAVLAGAALAGWIVLTDRKVARQDRTGT